MNRLGGMTWQEHVDQMQIDHAREREGAAVTADTWKPNLQALLAIHSNALDPKWCHTCHQLRPCDALDATQEAIRLQAKNARLQAVAEAARERSYEGHQEGCKISVGRCKCGQSDLEAALARLGVHAKVSDDREGRG